MTWKNLNQFKDNWYFYILIIQTKRNYLNHVLDNLELLKSTYFQLQFENLKKNFKEIKHLNIYLCQKFNIFIKKHERIY